MHMKKYILVLTALTMGMVSCKKDYTNPNAPTDSQVFSSVDGLTKAVVGIKQRWAVNGVGVSSLYQAISASGLSTGELTVLNAGNADLAQLQNGGTNRCGLPSVVEMEFNTRDYKLPKGTTLDYDNGTKKTEGLPQKGKVTIQYQQYTLNKGLPASLFSQ